MTRSGDRGRAGARTLLTAVLALSTLLVLLLTPTAATAATGHCRGHLVRTLRFPTGTLTVHRSGPYVCAQTQARSTRTRTTMSVTLQARGSRQVGRKARYTARTPPVTVHAGGRSIRVSGAVGRGSAHSGWFEG
ncbi:hypothetical protein [Streptomyces sp. NPDC007088]|uniref:hypothetical protein n=1 Tax=Streptomyces sp. NPDC007088 TaxID=3364773 RepID=UPI0036A47979